MPELMKSVRRLRSVYKNASSGNIQAEANRLYVVNLDTNCDLTLPVNPIRGTRAGYLVESVTGSSILRVSNAIFNTGTYSAYTIGYLPGDMLVVEWNGSNWYIVDRIVKPHVVTLIHADPLQLSPSGWTSVTFTGVVSDPANLWSPVDLGVKIRRPGYYFIYFKATVLGVPNTKSVGIDIKVGASSKGGVYNYSSIDGQAVTLEGFEFQSCNSTIVIKYNVYNQHTSALNVDVSSTKRPSLTVVEFLRF
jgi:hypothetical protein